MRFETNSVEETREIAKQLAKRFSVGDVICLCGDLGVGKTAFVSGFARGFGFEGYVSSPTFALIHEYPAKVPIYHFDMYRIENEDDAYAAGVDEYLYGDGVCLIEWSENIRSLLPQGFFTITIRKDADKDETYREIVLEDAK